MHTQHAAREVPIRFHRGTAARSLYRKIHPSYLDFLSPDIFSVSHAACSLAALGVLCSTVCSIQANPIKQMLLLIQAHEHCLVCRSVGNEWESYLSWIQFVWNPASDPRAR
ncbi:hypothetical protein DM02DRAFT_427331 [Periconia macrospinosa]|uniref:Uncharacterized protein n=1 Tax=Periconia macrospinosa TaxID=97972 RepID=A0A2V1E899_9PLEO|nr:hypothetical protein DM02DRAFT_427331 [Periconia macrospinosa]